MFYAWYFADLFYRDENDFFLVKAKLALKKKKLCGEENILKKGPTTFYNGSRAEWIEREHMIYHDL